MTRKEMHERSLKRKEKAKELFEQGKKDREIADILGLSLKTVKNIKWELNGDKDEKIDEAFAAWVRIVWPIRVNRILKHYGRPLQEVQKTKDILTEEVK